MFEEFPDLLYCLQRMLCSEYINDLSMAGPAVLPVQLSNAGSAVTVTASVILDYLFHKDDTV